MPRSDHARPTVPATSGTDHGPSATIPPRLTRVHTITGDRDALRAQPLQLTIRLVRRTRPVGAQHAMPRHLTSVPGHHRADRPRRPRADELRDVAVGHDASARDPVDRVEYA